MEAEPSFWTKGVTAGGLTSGSSADSFAGMSAVEDRPELVCLKGTIDRSGRFIASVGLVAAGCRSNSRPSSPLTKPKITLKLVQSTPNPHKLAMIRSLASTSRLQLTQAARVAPQVARVPLTRSYHAKVSELALNFSTGFSTSLGPCLHPLSPRNRSLTITNAHETYAFCPTQSRRPQVRIGLRLSPGDEVAPTGSARLRANHTREGHLADLVTLSTGWFA